MRTVAFIAARGGSKRVPGKNLREVGGVSLVRRALKVALAAGVEPWISSDDVAVMQSATGTTWPKGVIERYMSADLSCGDTEPVARDGVSDWSTSVSVGLHRRPPQLAGDHSQIEDAIAHYWTRLDDKPDVIVLLQPTSPFRTAAHVREALRLLEVTGADSVVGVTVGHEHHFAGRLKPRETFKCSASWGCGGGSMDDIGMPFACDTCGSKGSRSTFYDWAPFAPIGMDRPRTQDLRPMGAENGAIYATTRAAWEKSGLRASGHVVALPMTWIEGFDIDTEDCIRAANALVAGGVAE